MSKTFETQDLCLESFSLEEARDKALKMIKESTTKPSKKAHLIRDISLAPTSREIQRIMWNVYLVGTGFGNLDSGWQKLHKGTK